ncbi:phosphatidylinositol-glycan biosynthesis class X protein [Octodon degus]|uniref:Phosphatidylinositol-glycan biosynthesis class X protein n=1 Tax=Octodon degus TaxID=10160 RepID=A0A6P6DKE4_OCTDE|nr:phosphatidylinositol-glycan biosynthesis class X protein [Octodon degus]
MLGCLFMGAGAVEKAGPWHDLGPKSVRARSRGGAGLGRLPLASQLVPHALCGRPVSGVLAALALAGLLVAAAGLRGALTAGFSDAPSSSGTRATCPEIILRQEVLKDGFHRDLLIKVKFGESIKDLKTCRLLIKQSIPAGLFVDPYELASMQEKNITEVSLCSAGWSQTRKRLSGGSIIAFGYVKDLSWNKSGFIEDTPVHYRYHRPHSEDAETLIVVSNPDLLMSCDQEFPVLKCWAQSETEAPCALRSQDICQWSSLQYRQVQKNVMLRVPVGLTIHTSIVCSVTLLLTVLCSTLILIAVFKYGNISL